MTTWRRYEPYVIATVVLALIALPIAVHGRPETPVETLSAVCLIGSGLSLCWWRSHPREVVVAGAALLGVALLVHEGYAPDTSLAIFSSLALLLALCWSGRAALVAAGCGAVYLVVCYLLVVPSPVALLMFSVPAYVAGTVYRQKDRAVAELALRGEELEAERELFAAVARRHERARIAAELHDIVGHALSVMVVQAAAGQRLVDRDPQAASATLAAIAESAEQGRQDLARLVELLGGTEVESPDLSLIDEVVDRAARSGLDVTCRFEGDRDGVPAQAAHVAYRVVQEGLTNALRYAPSAPVRVQVEGADRGLVVRVQNDPAPASPPVLSGTGHGLAGLHERVVALGGRFHAGPTPAGGWSLEARLP